MLLGEVGLYHEGLHCIIGTLYHCKISMSADLQQNIFVTVYLLFTHNYIAFAYLAGLLIGIGLSIWRPSRFSTFILLGFAILLFSFEYDKHIISGLRDQTLQSLITVKQHYKVQRNVTLTITEILPVFFYVLGWALVFSAIIYAALKMHKKK